MLGTRLNEQRGKVSGELLSELCELVFVKGGCMLELKLADQRGKVRTQKSGGFGSDLGTWRQQGSGRFEKSGPGWLGR